MFGPMERLWLVGPICLVMFWLYWFAITRQGFMRYIVGVPFMVLNGMFNATIGTLIFAEFPREVFFTDRLKRMKKSHDPRVAKVAKMLCEEMNRADPGHC
jgi:hypothetical protein